MPVRKNPYTGRFMGRYDIDRSIPTDKPVRVVDKEMDVAMEKQGVVTDDTPAETQPVEVVKEAMEKNRIKMREDAFYKRILPPVKITNDELDRSISSDPKMQAFMENHKNVTTT